MYCTKCGKFIEHDATLCDECIATQRIIDEIGKIGAPEEEEPKKPEIKDDFDISIEDTILGITPEEAPAEEAPIEEEQKDEPKSKDPGYTIIEIPEEDMEKVDTPPAGSRKMGIGKGIAATVLSSVGYLFDFIALNVISMEDYVNYETLGSIALIFSILGAFICIPALVLSIISITTFKKCKRSGMIAPIPTLVLGIISIVMTASTLFLSFISSILGLIIIGGGL
jgi:hypothetical protein